MPLDLVILSPAQAGTDVAQMGCALECRAERLVAIAEYSLAAAKASNDRLAEGISRLVVETTELERRLLGSGGSSVRQ